MDRRQWADRIQQHLFRYSRYGKSYPGNPYRWHTVVDTPQYYQMATVDTLHSMVATDPEQDFYKTASTPAKLRPSK